MRRKVESLNTNSTIIALAKFAQLRSPVCRLYPTQQSRKRPTSPQLCPRSYMSKTVCALMVCPTRDETFFGKPLPPFRSVATNFLDRRRGETRPRNSGGCSTLGNRARSEEHTSELQSLMPISNAVFCWITKKHKTKD